MPETLKLLSAGALQTMVETLGAEFERESGVKLDISVGTAGAQADRVKAGEAVDLIMISRAGIDALDRLNLLRPASVTDLASTISGVIVREGSPQPDISTPDAFFAALKATPSFAYTDPKSGGSSGIMIAGMLEKAGLAELVNRKAVLCRGGHHVAETMAAGGAALGCTLISETLSVKGLTIVGPLPGALNFKNMYSAAIHAGTTKSKTAQAFLNFLTAPATRPRWTAGGMEAPF